MKNPSLSLLCVLAVLALIAACGGAAAPKPTQPLPTATRPPLPTATATPPPTPTRSPTSAPTTAPATAPAPSAPGGAPGSGGMPASLLQALNQSRTLTIFRLELSMTGKGSLMGGAAPATPGEEVALVELKGQVKGKDTHFTMKGLLAAFVVGDPDKGLEVISAGGRSYVRGPAPLLGADEDKWYLLPPEQNSVAQPPVQPGDLFGTFASKDADVSGFVKGAPETLDGRRCDVYTGDKEATVKLFQSLGPNAVPKDDLDQVDNAQSKFWACEDGYLHQMRMTIEGHDKDKPDQKGSFTLLLHLWDLNGDIRITAPENAEPVKK